MDNSIVQHIKGRVPAGANVLWHIHWSHLQVEEDFVPGRKQDGCGINQFVRKLAQLEGAINIEYA
jgi:hypothetical protein